MPWAEIHWRSNVIDKETVAQVLLPSTGKPPYATLYLLHGLGGDSTYWIRRSRLEWYARKLPLIVVMPDGYRGFFADNEEGADFGKHIGEELIEFIDRNFQTAAVRSSRAIGGCSMGGFGALSVGLNYSDRFCSVHSNGGSIELDADFSPGKELPASMRGRSPSFIAEMQRVFGSRLRDSRHDLLKLAKEKAKSDSIPKLRLDCGSDDPFLAANRKFHQDLSAAGIAHQYAEFAGNHDWDYYDARIPECLEFHAKNLGLSDPPK